MITGLDQLYELRHLERLKAEYCRTLDSKDWDAFRSLFTDDFLSDTSESGGTVIRGGDEFVGFVRRALGKAVTVHQVQQPEIDLTSPTTATGTWAMLDVIRFAPGVTMQGFGHYRETYEQNDGRWQIKTSKLTRLREEIRTPVLSIIVSDRLRRALQRMAPRAIDRTGSGFLPELRQPRDCSAGPAPPARRKHRRPGAAVP